MAIFNINGEEYDDMASAFDAVRRIWSESKVDAVRDQKIEALSKISDIDRERAAVGLTVTSDGGRATIGRL